MDGSDSANAVLALGHGAWVLGMTAYAAVYSWLGLLRLRPFRSLQQIESVRIMFSVASVRPVCHFVGQALGRNDETETSA